MKRFKFLSSEFNKKYPVKERIFIFYMFFFIFISSFTILSNILSGVEFLFNYKWMAMSLFCIILLAITFRKWRINLAHRLGIYCIILIILPAGWLNSTGLLSPSIVYSFLVMILINYLMRGWERIFANTAAILINMALISLFRFHPEVFKTMTFHEQYTDWIINVPVVFTFIAVLLITFEKAYETERIMSEKKSEKLNDLYRTDYLTGLYNRVHLSEKLYFIHNAYKRVNIPYSIIIMDIDYFKAYNDLYGHIKGDMCLQAFAKILKKRVTRDTDWVYRYGGEEFLVILGFTDKEGALKVADQIRKDLEEEAIPHIGSKIDTKLTVSMGIGTIRGLIQHPETILRHADEALYRSKESGRNRIRHYDDLMTDA